jgi:hypothetical protein
MPTRRLGVIQGQEKPMVNHPHRNNSAADPRTAKKAALEAAMRPIFDRGVTREEIEALMLATMRGFASDYDNAPLSWSKVYQVMDRCTVKKAA